MALVSTDISPAHVTPVRRWTAERIRSVGASGRPWAISLAAASLAVLLVATGCSGADDNGGSANQSSQPSATSANGSDAPGPLADRTASSSLTPASTTPRATDPPQVQAGEASDRPPFTLLGTTTTTRSVAGSDAEAAAAIFLAGYWSDIPRTYAELADVLAPVATERFLRDYRDPVHASDPVNGGQARHVEQITVQATQAAEGSATVAGRGVVNDATTGPRVLQRTLTLIRGTDGSWRVDTIQ
jgi:hypothetical protein